MSEEMSLKEAIYSTRAMRYLKPDPIPEEVLTEILDAAIRGPSGGNRQPWAWVVVRDAAAKKQIADWYREGWARSYGRDREKQLADAKTAGNVPGYLSSEHLALHLEEAPVFIFPVLRGVAGRSDPRTGSSIYGAVQNLMLAARARGIGSTLTTMYGGREKEIKELLGIPEDAMTMCLIPLGYPSRGQFTTPQRRPVERVVHWEKWGNRPGWKGED